jgi:transcriptional regulator of acetoin/glycerol metabolism
LEWLIGKFLGNEKENSSILLEPKAKQALLEYKWPGNIRQMANTLSLTKALSEGSISFHDLPEEVQLNSTYNSSDESLEDLLEGLNWNITAVANYLGCERSTIYRRMKKAKIVIERPDKGLE